MGERLSIHETAWPVFAEKSYRQIGCFGKKEKIPREGVRIGARWKALRIYKGPHGYLPLFRCPSLGNRLLEPKPDLGIEAGSLASSEYGP